MGSKVEGIRFLSRKRGCDEITSSFVAMRPNLLLSKSLIPADGGMVSVGSESVSSLTINCGITKRVCRGIS